MQGVIYTFVLGIMFTVTLFAHTFFLGTAQKSVFKADTVYDSILRGTGAETPSLNCGTGMVYTISKMKYRDGSDVKVFVPKVNALSGITDYDTWVASVNVDNCNSELPILGASQQKVSLNGITLSGSTTELFLGKNTVKNDNSVSY